MTARERVAIHEAGHSAWAAIVANARVDAVTIRPTATANGSCDVTFMLPPASAPLAARRDAARRECETDLAGTAAVAIALGIQPLPSRIDQLRDPDQFGELATAREYLAAVYPPDEVDAVYADCWRTVLGGLRHPRLWRAVETLAAALLVHSTLQQPQLNELLAAAVTS